MNKTILAIGVIALFIGVGIQPAISNELTIPKISNSEEDCDCNIPNGKLHLAEKVINKAENYLESKDLIKSDIIPFERPVCQMLLDIGIYYGKLYAKYEELLENTTYGTPEYYYYVQFVILYEAIIMSIIVVGVIINCWDDPFPPPY
jgi:hypothetical protein